MSAVCLNSYFVLRQRAGLIRDSRSNYRQSLGNTNAWVNSDCSFHKIARRNNNTGIVLCVSLGELGRGYRTARRMGNWQTNRAGNDSPDPTTTGSGFWHQACQLREEKPSLSYLLPIKPTGSGLEQLERNEETHTKGKIRPC